MITVVLTSYNMGEHATESDYDSWIEYVADHFCDESGEALVDVDVRGFGECSDNQISGGTPDEETRIRETLSWLWDEWCSQ